MNKSNKNTTNTNQQGNLLPLLLIDDDPMDRENIQMMLGNQYSIEEAANGEDGWKKLNSRKYAAILLDLDLGRGMSGFDFIEKMRKENLWIPVVIVSTTGSIDKVVRAMKMGAANYIGKGAGGMDMEIALQKALSEIEMAKDNQLYRDQIDAMAGRLVLESEANKNLFLEIQRLAPTNSTTLISGETGVGKEIVAREIHRLSKRSKRPLICVNCASLKDTLVESELFGHEKGTFTGATRRRMGYFEMADGCTLFLDEIGEMNLDIQTQFLRVLEHGTFKRTGGEKDISVDVRIIAATNRDLIGEVKSRKFREDLYYRLDVARLEVRPLRERKPDILPLANIFLSDLNAERGSQPIQFSKDALMALTSYRWPGNVRELKNIVERCFLYPNDSIIDKNTVLHHLPIDTEILPDYKESKQRVLDDFEREYIQAALKITGSNLTKAAELMGLKRFGLQKAIKRLDISVPDKA